MNLPQLKKKKNSQTIAGSQTDAEKSEPAYTAGGNVKRFSHFGKTVGISSKRFSIDLPYAPAIPPLAIYPIELKTGV